MVTSGCAVVLSSVATRSFGPSFTVIAVVAVPCVADVLLPSLEVTVHVSESEPLNSVVGV